MKDAVREVLTNSVYGNNALRRAEIRAYKAYLTLSKWASESHYLTVKLAIRILQLLWLLASFILTFTVIGAFIPGVNVWLDIMKENRMITKLEQTENEYEVINRQLESFAGYTDQGAAPVYVIQDRKIKGRFTPSVMSMEEFLLNTVHKRGLLKLSGTGISDTLSSIPGFDRYFLAKMKDYERMKGVSSEGSFDVVSMAVVPEELKITTLYDAYIREHKFWGALLSTQTHAGLAGGINAYAYKANSDGLKFQRHDGVGMVDVTTQRGQFAQGFLYTDQEIALTFEAMERKGLDVSEYRLPVQIIFDETTGSVTKVVRLLQMLRIEQLWTRLRCIGIR
jgi:hypothetical protein